LTRGFSHPSCWFFNPTLFLVENPGQIPWQLSFTLIKFPNFLVFRTKIHQTKMEKTPPTKFQISCSNLQLLSAFFMSFIHFQNVQEMPTRSACHVFAGVCGDQFSLGFWWLKKSHVISILPGGGVGSSKGSRGFLNLEELMVLKKKTELMGVSLSHDLLRHHGGVIIRNTP